MNNSSFLELKNLTIFRRNKTRIDEHLEKVYSVTPLGTQHMNFLGKYIFEENKIETKDGKVYLDMKESKDLSKREEI